METPDFVVNPWNGRLYSQRYHELLKERSSLPVWQYKEQFLQALKDNQKLIVIGLNGGGKTTQIPQFVLEGSSSSIIHHDQKQKKKKMMVACIQPRPMSAMSVSCRVAEEMDVAIGEEVGYSTPFEDCTSAKTVLKCLTYDMLLREAMTSDPLLKHYNVIILDEAHERTLATDILVAYLKQCVLKDRPDLKLVVMCCTTRGATDLVNYFPDSALFGVAGGHHPVEIFCSEKEPSEQKGGYLGKAIISVLMIHLCEDPGDILVFLAEEDDIVYVCMEITFQMEKVLRVVPGKFGPVEVVPVYSASPPAMLQKMFDPAPRTIGLPGRKIVVTTDIAESSLTIDGIVYVVDTGYAREKVYNHQTHTESMQVLPISLETAKQRAMHAGRTRPGKCFRLHTEERFISYEDTYPEILRSSLASTVLTLKRLGIDDLVRFEFMDPPAPEALIRAQHVLNCLGALDNEGNLTTLGELMSEFPLDPQMSKMLIVSPGFNCSNEILTITAMLSVPDCFVGPRGSIKKAAGKAKARPRKSGKKASGKAKARPRESRKEAADKAKARFSHIDGDHIRLLNVYQAYKLNNEDPSWCNKNFVNARALESADSLRQQLMCIMSRLQLMICSTDFNDRDYCVNIRKAMLAGYFMQVAHLDRSGHYLTVKDNQEVTLHPSNCLDPKPEWVIYNEHVLTSKSFIRTVTAVRGEWLVEIAPHYYDPENFPQCEAKRVLERLHKMVIEESKI